jgi:hypothetical protein
MCFSRTAPLVTGRNGMQRGVRGATGWAAILVYSRVVITASEVHDPASSGGSVGVGASLGNLKGMAEQGAAFEMIDGGDYDSDKAYKDSKVCSRKACRSS